MKDISGYTLKITVHLKFQAKAKHLRRVDTNISRGVSWIEIWMAYFKYLNSTTAGGRRFDSRLATRSFGNFWFLQWGLDPSNSATNGQRAVSAFFFNMPRKGTSEENRLVEIFFTRDSANADYYIYRCGMRRKRSRTSYTNMISHIRTAHNDNDVVLQDVEEPTKANVDH